MSEFEFAPYVRPPPSLEELDIGPGEPMDTERHAKQMNLLVHSLDSWTARDDFYVAGDMWVYFNELQKKKNEFRAPDVFVVLGAERRERRAWVVWLEDGKMPDVVIELLSPTTEHVDRGEKMRVYAKVLKVGEYFLFDPFSGVLEAYTLEPTMGEYRRKPETAEGRVRCEQLGLWLGRVRGAYQGLEVDWLRWLDASGTPLPTAEERANAMEERAKQLEAELAALKASGR